jgi:addiction module RelE/StbE family toxin
MNGKTYEVFMAPSAYRRYKKLTPSLQRKVQEEAQQLAENPHRYEELKGPLKGIYSYHFHFEDIQYRIAYRIIERASRIEIVLVKSRQSFYESLRQIVK